MAFHRDDTFENVFSCVLLLPPACHVVACTPASDRIHWARDEWKLNGAFISKRSAVVVNANVRVLEPQSFCPIHSMICYATKPTHGEWEKTIGGIAVEVERFPVFIQGERGNDERTTINNEKPFNFKKLGIHHSLHTAYLFEMDNTQWIGF